jgi:hypothetical protein
VHFFGVLSVVLAKLSIPGLSHTRYSSDLAPADSPIFSKVEIAKKRFEALSSNQQTVTRELKAIWKEAFSRALDSL